jgi:lysophospholipase L1-like esterase
MTAIRVGRWVGVRGVGLGLASMLTAAGCAASSDPSPAAAQTVSSDALESGSVQSTVMPLGDSITWGLDHTGGDRNDGGYRSRLFAGLQWNGIGHDRFRFVGTAWNGWAPGDQWGTDTPQEGHPGWTSQDLSDNLWWVLERGKPNYVLLMIGTNDLIQDFSTDRSIQLMESVYDRILANPSVHRVFVASVIPAQSSGSYGGLQNGNIEGLNRRIQLAVDYRAMWGKPITFVDMYRWSGINDSDLSDGVHPNASGYAKMGTVWTLVIKDYL